jgi:drug/metabolite transporter (DMT)-like permease
MEAGTGSLFFFAQPVVGAVLGWLLLGERLGGRFLAGSLVLILGGILAVRAERKT